MTKNSKVLALKYRPQVFEDLIGQEIVSQTIFNGIKSENSANAYLFTGIRGVGKTTFARIVAKSLNCENGIENLCKDNFCNNCESIIDSNHMDVLEIDAASKTGVDDVRDLIEFSRYGPTSAKYKIFIIDEVHMLSKQAFNALLKTLEEPPQYLKFIFATTEVKKIPVTVISRCQRYDLSRIKSEELFQFIKKICLKENGKASDDALKLIVKISEGSVRDALSLLDRGLMSNKNGQELSLDRAQVMFGSFDKSSLIDLFEDIFKGDEDALIQKYRKIYQTGIEPRIFLNDFLEVLYYFKNIASMKMDGTNFSLNDQDFSKISNISSKIDNKDLILFWHYTIKVLEEINYVSNQNLSIEMFLSRLVYLKGFKKNNIEPIQEINQTNEDLNKKIFNKEKFVEQIKNINQEEEPTLKKKLIDPTNQIFVKNLGDIINLCNFNKEVKLKYELENNVNLVSFSNHRIEISFNEKLDKNFIKDLSEKLFQWTGSRWIISLSQKKGSISQKDQQKIDREKNFKKIKDNLFYKKVLDLFPDAELINFEIQDKEKNND